MAVMAMEDIMQSNTKNARDEEMEIDLLQLASDIWNDLCRSGWITLYHQ